MNEHNILLDVEKFKEILVHSWELLPKEKQKELLEMGIYPKKINSRLIVTQE